MDFDTAKQMTSPCGIPCFHCPAHMAVGNPEIRKQVAGVLGIPDRYITHAPQSDQLDETGLTAEHIAAKVRELISAGRGAMGSASGAP